jgi:formate dehydrogenase
VAKVENGRVVHIGPDRDNPHSRGHLCVKGPAIAEIAYDVDRVTRPLKRVGGPGEFEPVSWDEALRDIAARLKATMDEYGSDAVATYFGNPGAFSTDTFMSSQWFLNRLGSRKFYTAGTQDSTSRHLASYILYGVAFRNCIPDLPYCDFLIVIGANPFVSHGGLLTAPRIRHDFDAIAARGRVVVIDPRCTETAERYEHVAIRPNADTWLLAAMLRTIFDEGLADEAFLAAHTNGVSELRAAVADVIPDEASDRTGVPPDTIRQLARDFAQAKRGAIYSRVGLCRGTFSTLANTLVDALNICTGKFARRGGSVFGAFPLHGGPEPLEGYGEETTRIGDIPIVGGMMAAAVLPDDILEPGEGRVRAMMLVAGNPVLSAPGGERLELALQSLDLLFSIDLYVTESNRYAHYILPSATFLEKGDVPLIGLSHMPRPFIQYSPAVIDKVGESREELEIFRDLAERMGLGSIIPDGLDLTPLQMVDMGLRMGPAGDGMGARAGLSLEALLKNPHGVMLDLPLTYEGWQKHIAYDDGRLRLWHPILEAEFERFGRARSAPDDKRLRLFSQRTLKSLNSWMHNSEKLVRSQKPELLMHPDDATSRGISSGDLVTISTETGTVVVTAKVTPKVTQGSVCYPHGWGHRGGWRTANAQEGVNINVLLPRGVGAVERVSGTAFIDGVPVEIARAPVAALEPASAP